MCCDCKDIAKLIDQKLGPLYRVLGFNPPTKTGSNAKVDPVTITPQRWIELAGKTVYAGDNPTSIKVGDLPSILAALAAPIYYKSGLQRFPATLPKSLIAGNGDHDTQKIEDAISLQEWLIKQLDSLFGQFPIEIKVKGDDKQEHSIKLDNITESIAELVGLALSTAADADFGASLAMRAVLEASKAGNAALIAQDYAKANAQFLGYKGNEKERQVRSTITPDKHTQSEFLQPSTQKLVGWEFAEQSKDETLLAAVKTLLLSAGIVKAALIQDWKPGDPVTGDYMKQARQQHADDDTDWEQFLTLLRYPPANRKISDQPTPDIKDLTKGDGLGDQ